MKKIVIVLLVVFCFSTPNVSYGEAGLWKKFVSSYKRYFEKGTGSRSKILQPKQLESFVRKRAADSRKELKNMPWNLMYRNEQPALQIKGWSKYMSKALYPNTPWLQSASQQVQERYFIALHNRLAAKVAKQRIQLLKDIRAEFYRLLKERTDFTKMSKSFAWQAAQQVSPNVKQILIGEEHDNKKISQTVLAFMKEIKAQNPQRQIVYLSEFMMHGGSAGFWLRMWETPDDVEGYAQIMRWVDQSGMVSNGLESIYVSQTFLTQVVLKPFSQQEPTSMSLWRTLGGVYLRNIYWRKIIEETREKYPDALFIIHAGAGHVNYTAPYTVARFFKPEETFVLEVSSRDGGLFHAYTKGGFDIEPILGWRDKDLARLVGYDVRILVPGAVTKK